MTLDRRGFLTLAGSCLIGSSIPALRAQTLPGSPGQALLGASLPLSGPDAAMGHEILAILQSRLAAAGMELRALDDGSEMSRVDANVATLTEEGSLAIVGLLGRKRLDIATRSAGQTGIALLPLAVLQSESRPNLGLRPSIEVESALIAEGLAELQLGRIGVLYSLTGEGRRRRIALAHALSSRGIEITADVSSKPGGAVEARTRDVAARVRQRQVDALVSVEEDLATSRLAATSRDFGWAVPLVCSSACRLQATVGCSLGVE